MNIIVFVTHRVPKGHKACACCCTELKDGYLHELETGLYYCDAVCFRFHSHMAWAAIENAARQVS